MVIELSRLRLRAFKPADASAVVSAMNDWEVAQWLIVPSFPYTESDFSRFAELVRLDHLNTYPKQFALARRGTDQVVGCIAITAKAEGVGELGYWIDRSCWGQGLASEAAPAVVEAAERDPTLRRLFATTDPVNLASRLVLERAGFAFKGEYKRDLPTRRGTAIACLYERIPSALATH